MADIAGRRARLEITDLGYTYPGRRATCALDGLTFDVIDHEFVALVGPVGCGKTTLLRIIAGFLSPTHGTVLDGGEPVRGPQLERGYVFQEDAVFPWMSVQQNLEFGLRAKGLDRAAREAVVAELIGLIRLRGYERAYPLELSAGMAKMVEVARVLATDPDVLLLDEPFGALDAQTRARLQDELGTLCEKRRKTVLLVTHDVEEAVALADRILVLSARPGRLRAEIAVPLPRPRPLLARLTPAFAEVKRRVWTELGLATGPRE